ncbi:hypothetical protein [Streptomyces qinglanensis]|uniref:Uncharacterized protein n=1 Tax=Streptomyces qinglanensis TaxID=943816 RepID=A0A1H9VDF5_9ACTN|nr:hypothetical protein [Streptomyces qinglanensis]SES19323.1 hypothetical protein SAMN05421870_111163 [Streptomyces qinglanensis]
MSFLGRIRGAASRRTLLLAGAGVLTLALLAVLVPALLLGEDGSDECRQAPDSARAQANDPKRAAKELDPGEDVNRTGPLKRLLRTTGSPLCEGTDGTQLAGRALVAATTGRTTADQHELARPHTERAARVTHAAVLLLSEKDRSSPPDFPLGLNPYLARMFASYIQDTSRGVTLGEIRDWEQPTATDEEAEYEDRSGSGNWATPFPSGHDVHVVFPLPDGAKRVVRRVAASPRAFATLYDAERARFAWYLERLTHTGQKPGEELEKKTLSASLKLGLGQSATFVAELMAARTVAVEDGLAPSLAQFDRAVLRHTRGLYHPAEHQIHTRPSAATLAQRRPDASAGQGKRAVERLMDGRVQLYAVLDAWARQRDIPAARTERLRTEMDTWYARGLNLR